MINVQTLFLRVQDLSVKDKAGYLNSEQFNRDLAQAQLDLFEYYYQQFENTQKIVDSLMPFIKEVDLPIQSGWCDFPTDYRHRLEVAYLYMENTDACGGAEPKVDEWDMTYLNANEERETKQSAIRKPDISTKCVYHAFVNNRIKVLPQTLLGYIKLKYLKVPPAAIYGVTLDVANDQENYNPATSVNSIFNDQDTQNLVDLMLFYKGIEVRETPLLEWVGLRRQLNAV